MNSPLRITLIQSTLHWENIPANLQMFSEKISALKGETDIIILPEMFSTGFSMNAAALAETMEGTAIRWMREKASEKNCIITGSLIIKDENVMREDADSGTAFYNRLIWMKPDGTFLQYDKRHLFRLAHEEQIYTPGHQKIIIEYKGWRILPLVCFDLRFPVWSRRTKTDGYDLLIYVANWPERRVLAWSQLLIARAIENQCYVAGLNRIGNDGHDVYHSGESAVINFKGENMSGICAHEECIETVALDKSELENFRNQLPFIEDADDFKILV
jgi:omega-amidase